MPATAQALKPDLVGYTIRRFSVADLSRHGGWIMRRLIERYPHQNERYMAGWLNGLIASNESCFLYQDHAVALAQLVNTFNLDLKPVVQERFVWAEEPEKATHVEAAAQFYDWFAQWAKAMSIEKIIVEEMSDVPHEQIKERLGQLYTTQLTFARV